MNLRLIPASLLTLMLLCGCQNTLIPPAAAAQPTPVVTPATEVTQGPLIQVAILLDTSSSMDGLIEQTKSQLWKMVNEFSKSNQNGKAPRVEVALYEYGKSTVPAKVGYVRQILPLSQDLDKLSEELFALRTNGGEEYCGWVIQTATRELAWSDDPKALKVIFIAGNEPFTQGPVNPMESCSGAHARGILVNTIHCGARQVGIQQGWEQGAVAGDGRFLVIDQNQKAQYVAAPQDDEIARLSGELNKSYVPYGEGGGAAVRRQSSMDQANAHVSGAVAAERAYTKSTENYNNSQWDVIDAVKSGQKLEDMPAASLPLRCRRWAKTSAPPTCRKKRASASACKSRFAISRNNARSSWRTRRKARAEAWTRP